jgi:hypothetical protein
MSALRSDSFRSRSCGAPAGALQSPAGVVDQHPGVIELEARLHQHGLANLDAGARLDREEMQRVQRDSGFVHRDS